MRSKRPFTATRGIARRCRGADRRGPCRFGGSRCFEHDRWSRHPCLFRQLQLHGGRKSRTGDAHRPGHHRLVEPGGAGARGYLHRLQSGAAVQLREPLGRYHRRHCFGHRNDNADGHRRHPGKSSGHLHHPLDDGRGRSTADHGSRISGELHQRQWNTGGIDLHRGHHDGEYQHHRRPIGAVTGPAPPLPRSLPRHRRLRR